MRENNTLVEENDRRLKEIIKDAVREVIEEEFMKLRLSIISYISESEQKEIEEKYGKPSDEFVRKIELN